MRENVKKQIRNAKKRRIRRRRFYAAVALCSILVAGIVSWKLILPGTAMSGETYCGKEEHTHSDACYEQVLVCGQEEGVGAHTHTDACYTDVRTDQLICGQEESAGHVHTDACYTNELTCGQEENAEHTHTDACYTKTLTCGQEEGAGAHTHTDACYATERKLTCGQEEGAGHTHTDACYKTELTCGKEEHKHTSECYSNPDAVETEDQWKAAFKNYKLTGEWGKDTAAVAKSQVGYKESTENYKVNEDKSTDGYTRYADWAGDDIYGEWNTDFAAFCLNYAGVPADKFPVNADDLGTWITAMNNAGYYGDPDSTEPQPGDLIVLKKADQDNKQTIGIVSEVKTDKDGNVTTVKVIEGDCDDAVKENKHDADSSEIVGYGLVNEAYGDVYGSENLDIQNSVKDQENQEENDSVVADNDISKVKPKRAVALYAADEENGSDAGDETETNEETGNTLMVHTISGSGTTYDPTTDQYNTTLRIDFTVTNTGGIADDTVFTYTYPSGVNIPENLLDGNFKHSFYDDNNRKLIGYYQFVKNPDGTYTIQVKFDSDYIQIAGSNINGYIDFSGSLNSSSVGEDGKIHLDGSDDVDLTIEPDKITYPSDETNQYNIDVSKGGSYIETNGDKLVYTVCIYTKKGTPGPINFTDTITMPSELGASLDDVKVEKGYRDYYGENSYNDLSLGVMETQPKYEYNQQTGQLTMNLDRLTVNPNAVDNNGDSCIRTDYYKITYTYNITEIPDTSKVVHNTVKVSAKDEVNKQTVTDTSSADVTVYKDRSYTIDKSGSYSNEDNSITWTIVINKNHMDIAGMTLTDDMFANLSDNDFSVSPNSNYEIIRDTTTGKITGIQFQAENEGVNNNAYTITYTTPVQNFDDQWNDHEVTNEATLEKGDEKISTGTGTVTVPGEGSVEKSSGDLTPAADGKTGTIQWTVKLNLPENGLPTGATIEDDVTKGAYDWQNNTNQWLTEEQKDNLKSTLMTIFGNDINVTFTKSENGYSGFSVSFPDGLLPQNDNNSYQFSYETTVSLEAANIGSNTFYNTVQVGDKTITAEENYSKPGVVKMDSHNQTQDTEVTNSTGKLTWLVELTMDDKPRTSITVTDTLPQGVSLTSLKIQKEFGSWESDTITATDGNSQSKTIGGFTFKYEASESDPQTITLTITKDNQQFEDSGKFMLTYDCQMSDQLMASQDPETGIVLTNEVTANADGSVDWGSSQQTQTWTEQSSSTEEKVVNKSGEWDNNNRRIHYKVVLNPNGEDLVEGTDYLTLNDTLNYSPSQNAWTNEAGEYKNLTVTIEASLVQNSVKLYEGRLEADGTFSKGNEITDWNWTCETERVNDWLEYSRIKAENIPDEIPLILEYEYILSSDAPEGYTININNISNTAGLEGTSYSSTDTSNNWQWSDQDTSGGGNTDKSYTFYKVEAGKFGHSLEGAEFSVYAYDNNTNSFDNSKPVKTDKTNSNGILQIKWDAEVYAYNTLYKVVETTAPSGYSIPDPTPEYYFYFSKEGEESFLPTGDELPATAVDLSVNSHTEYVENAVSYRLPETGGIGTKVYTAGGAILILSSCLLGGYRMRRKRERRRR